MSGSRIITYRFVVPGAMSWSYDVELELPTLKLKNALRYSPPPWTLLDFDRCPNCPSEMDGQLHCPVAVHLIPVIEVFRDHTSHVEAEVHVHTECRDYMSRCSLQTGLSSLVGLIMATSGCPILDRLRPMAYTHLPFSNAKETTFRAISTYLMAQFIRQLQGRDCDWELNRLVETYEEVRLVNRAFADRVRSMSGKDAGVNAMLLLDTFAGIASFALHKRWWEEIEPLFAPESEYYAEPGCSCKPLSAQGSE